MRSTDINIIGNLTRRNATSRATTLAPSRFKLLIVIAAWGICLLSFNFQASAGTLSQTFENKTGNDANDLHIKYNRPAKVISQTPEAFDKVDDGAKEGKNIIDLSDGTVAAGGKVKVKAEAMTGDLEVNEWWWTDKNHKRLGEVYTGCSPSDGCSADTEMFDTASLSGVVTVEMKTEKGSLKLNLPAALQPGDTISALVEDERQGASDELSGNVIEINGEKHQLRNKILTIVIPTAGLSYPFILKNGAGHEIARCEPPRGLTGTIPTQLGNIAPPQSAILAVGSDVIGQTGRNLSVLGNFDGEAATTNVTIGNHPALIVAEWPRGTVFRVPRDAPTGQTTLSITETGGNSPMSSQSAINVVSLTLRADKLHLIRGEHTNLQFFVTGLKGFKGNSRLFVQNMTPEVVKLSFSDKWQSVGYQTEMLPDFVHRGSANGRTPGLEQTSDTFESKEKLTGISAGAFNIVGTVVAANPVAGASNCECKCEFAKPPILSAGTRAATGGGTEYGFEPNVKISCNGNRCEVQKVEYAWTVGAGSTATYSVHKDTDKAKKLVVDVTKEGTLELSVTVTVTCSDGKTCSKTGSKTFTLKK